MAFTNSVLLIVTLVRPVPQFSSSGTLLTISARGNATLGRTGTQDDLSLPQEVEAGGSVRGPPENLNRKQVRRGRCKACTGESLENPDKDERTGDEGWLLDDEDCSMEDSSECVKKQQKPDGGWKAFKDGPQFEKDNNGGAEEDFLILEDGNDAEDEPANLDMVLSISPAQLQTRQAATREASRVTEVVLVSSTTSTADLAFQTLLSEDQLSTAERQITGTGSVPSSGFVDIWIGPLGVCVRRG